MTEIIRDIRSVQLARPSVLTIGSFDGVHRGHAYLLNTVIEHARLREAASIAVTLHPHPRLVLRPDTPLALISTLEERLDLMQPLGLDYVVVFPFTIEHSRMRAREFVALLQNHLRMVELVCGPNFALGFKREGTIPVLQELGAELGFQVTVVEPRAFAEGVISSTRVRERIAAGDVKTATEMLGHYPTVRGIVVHGDHRGRELGFPTANLALPERKLIPADGIYAVHVRLKKARHKDGSPTPPDATVDRPEKDPNESEWFDGAASVGIRPTFGGGKRLVEVYILDFDRWIYGDEIELYFVKRLRDEEKFPTVQALVEQMKKDVAAARRVLSTQPLPANVRTLERSNV